MFIEKLETIDLGGPIYGRTIVGCAPKGATTSQLCLPFYRHFTATRFFRRTPSAGRVSKSKINWFRWQPTGRFSVRFLQPNEISFYTDDFRADPRRCFLPH